MVRYFLILFDRNSGRMVDEVIKFGAPPKPWMLGLRRVLPKNDRSRRTIGSGPLIPFARSK
jgi:hypothetical protein